MAGLVMLVGAMTACGDAEPATLEERAQGIDQRLICPYCPAETIDQAQVPQAKEMRAFVREKLAEGWTDRQILDYFSAPERYGPRVLAEPPKSGATLAIWLTPPAALALGGAAVWLVLRSMSGRPRPGGEAPTDAPDLAPYLARVDEELSSRRRDDDPVTKEDEELSSRRRDDNPGPQEDSGRG